MAFAKPANKYTVVETNHVAAVMDGRMASQYPTKVALQNGMAVIVDYAKKEVKLPLATSKNIALHASEEQIYEDHLGRNSFYIPANGYPRALFLSVGDIFETNALADIAGNYAAEDVLHPDTSGFWSTTGTVVGITGVIVEKVTLPNGSPGAKIAITAVDAPAAV